MTKIVFWVWVSFLVMSPCFATGFGERLKKNKYGGLTLTDNNGDRFVAKPDGKGGYAIKGPDGYQATARPDGKGGFISSDSKGFSYQAAADGQGGYDVVGDNGKKLWVAKVKPSASGGFRVDSRYKRKTSDGPVAQSP